jgi:hypothetical protein
MKKTKSKTSNKQNYTYNITLHIKYTFQNSTLVSATITIHSDMFKLELNLHIPYIVENIHETYVNTSHIILRFHASEHAHTHICAYK